MKSLIVLFCLIILILNFDQSFLCKIQLPDFFLSRHVAALVLARGGSKGIPLKNLAKLGNDSLLSLSLKKILSVSFTSVWVSTDHWLILQEAGDVNVHWRSKESASDDAPSILGILDFIQFHPEIDVVALIQCTSPFLKEKYLQEALGWIKQGVECVFSVTRSHNLRWIETKNGTIHPVNFDPKNRPRRQDWTGELIENGMFYFTTRKLVQQGFLQNNRYTV